MRSFSQHQNNVVFLFVGAKFFTELRNPNWNEYFVQAVTLRVNYLKREDALKLITKPVEDFNLVYPHEVSERIFELTQGHPALLQLICRKMVDIANQDGKKDMTLDDLDKAISETIDRETHAINVFWTQFCTPADRLAVKEILNNIPPSNKVSLSRLKEHGYVVEDGESVKMRAPLFEMWLREYADTFEFAGG